MEQIFFFGFSCYLLAVLGFVYRCFAYHRASVQRSFVLQTQCRGCCVDFTLMKNG
ncbi:MAG: hypothetical protein SD837_15520 [Candidatus Electrothrix scaldis]|nr:MAG: hypothetical protein SD837_15520 [Candidatus Electrothrix sp. GW3-3]